MHSWYVRFSIQSLLPVTLSETSAELITTKRSLSFLNYFEQKSAPAWSFWPCGSNFSLKLQGKWGFWPHKRDKCRICLVDKFGIYHGGGRWIRTTEGIASRFTVCPLWPLGNSPIFNCGWSWWTDSNPRPADYKSAALPTELHQRFQVPI